MHYDARNMIRRYAVLFLRSARYILRLGLRIANRLLRSLTARKPPAACPVSADTLAVVRQFLSSLDKPSKEADEYVQHHIDRLAFTVLLAPKPRSSGRCLELGSYMHLAPALKHLAGYRQVSAASFGPKGIKVPRKATVAGQEIFHCDIDLFDVERDEFPYASETFELVLCCELLEHLTLDPMHMLSEIHRVLEDAGVLLITTPNCASAGSLEQILWRTSNPYTYSLYPNPQRRDSSSTASHVREYTPDELSALLACAGFRLELIHTREGRLVETRDLIQDILLTYGFPADLRGEQIFCLARKVSAADRERYPPFLYG